MMKPFKTLNAGFRTMHNTLMKPGVHSIDIPQGIPLFFVPCTRNDKTEAS